MILNDCPGTAAARAPFGRVDPDLANDAEFPFVKLLDEEEPWVHWGACKVFPFAEVDEG